MAGNELPNPEVLMTSPTPLLDKLKQTLGPEEQNNNALQEILGGSLNMDKYNQIIRPFIHTKSAPDSLANEIQTKANAEAVIMILEQSTGIIKHITNKFFLANMQMSMREKVQLMETFGAANVSFFGEAARVYIFSASTVDAPSQDSGIGSGKYYYQSSILKMYNEELRGSQLIKKNRIAVMKVHNHLIYGFPLSLQIVYDANIEPVTQFVLQFVVAEHSLELPGVVTEKYLESMYSTTSHINNDKIWEFLVKIENIQSKIAGVLNTKVSGENYNSSGTIESIQNASFNWYNYQPDSMKSAYTTLLASNVTALQTVIGGILDGEISPLVESKIPRDTIKKLLAVIHSMFREEETFNLVATHLRSLILLNKELGIFKSYRINYISEPTQSVG